MNNSKNIYLFSLLFALIFVYSCGSDSSTSPSTPSGTVLYSMDSISVWLQPSSHATGHDSLYFSTQNTGGFKVEFTLQADIDTMISDTTQSPHSNGYWSSYSNALPVSLVNNPVYGIVDHSETLQHSFVSGQSTYFSLAVTLNVTNSTRVHFIRLKNIKITKL